MESGNKNLEKEGQLQISTEEVSEKFGETLSIADAPPKEVCEGAKCQEGVCEKEATMSSTPSATDKLKEKNKDEEKNVTEKQQVLKTDDATLLADVKEDETIVEESTKVSQKEMKSLQADKDEVNGEGECEKEVMPSRSSATEKIEEKNKDKEKNVTENQQVLKTDDASLLGDAIEEEKNVQENTKMSQKEMKPFETDKDEVNADGVCEKEVMSSTPSSTEKLEEKNKDKEKNVTEKQQVLKTDDATLLADVKEDETIVEESTKVSQKEMKSLQADKDMVINVDGVCEKEVMSSRPSSTEKLEEKNKDEEKNVTENQQVLKTDDASLLGDAIEEEKNVQENTKMSQKEMKPFETDKDEVNADGVCEKEVMSSTPSSTEKLEEKNKDKEKNVLKTDDATLLADVKKDETIVEESTKVSQKEIKPLQADKDEVNGEGECEKEATMSSTPSPTEKLEEKNKDEEKNVTENQQVLKTDDATLLADVKEDETIVEESTKVSQKKTKPFQADKNKVNAKPALRQAANTTSRPPMAYCYVCNLVLNSTSEAIQHFQGKKHLKKMRTWQLVAMNKRRNTVRHQAIKAAETGKHATKTLTSVDQKFYCNVCRKYMNSTQQYTMHVESNKHLKKVGEKEEQMHGNQVNDTEVHGNQVNDTHVFDNQVLQKNELRDEKMDERKEAICEQIKSDEQTNARSLPTPSDMDFHRYNEWLQCQEPMMPQGRGRAISQNRRVNRGRGWYGNIYNSHENNHSQFTGRRHQSKDVASRGRGNNSQQGSMMQQPARVYSHLRENKHQGPQPSLRDYALSEYGQSRGYNI